MTPPTDYLATADVWAVLDLIATEFKSDPTSVQCFDLRLVARTIALAAAHTNAHRHQALETEDRDAVLLALAVLSLDRPGWRDYLHEVADKIAPRTGRATLERFRGLNADRWQAHGGLGDTPPAPRADPPPTKGGA